MIVGELFASLGIIGADKTVGAITQARDGMKGLGEVSLQTKAAILGAMYALERAFSSSNQKGTQLTNLNAILGDNLAKTVQQYQWAGQQVGVTNDEVAGTFKSLQSVITDTLLGKGGPEGLARLSTILSQIGMGDIEMKDLERLAQHPEELLQKLQAYAAKEPSKLIRNKVLDSFGIGGNMQAALIRQAFTPDKLAKAPVYNDKEIETLDRLNAKWKNLGTTLEMALGRFNAKHGDEIIDTITKISAAFLKLAEAFTTIAEKSKLFDGVTEVLKGWEIIFKGLDGSLEKITKLTTSPETPEEKKASEEGGILSDGAAKTRVMLEAAAQFFKSAFGIDEEIMGQPEKVTPEQKKKYENTLKLLKKRKEIDELNNQPADGGAVKGAPTDAQKELQKKSAALAPTMPAIAAGNTNTNNVDIQQTLNFNGDRSDTAQVADATRKAISDAYRSSFAQSQVV